MLCDCLRVTVGSPQENERFMNALKESLDHE
jgi:histidinol-phosphate/aromatic aminotransferase/cobyric acid decarboxylase-like protein